MSTKQISRSDFDSTNTVPGQCGFTLVEIIITILIAAIMAAGIVTYIGDSVEGFAASANRNQLASSGRTAIDRMALELHNALPNSVRVAEAGGNQCLEFIPFVGATTYVDASFSGSGDDFVEVIDFNPPLRFDPHDTLAPPADPLADFYAVIYPITTADLYAYDELLPVSAPGGPISRVDYIRNSYEEEFVPDNCVDAEIIVAPGDVAAAQRSGRAALCLTHDHLFEHSSPVDRLYIAQQPVSFCIVSDRIYRYENYGFQTTQCTPADPGCLPATAADGRHLITDNVDNTGTGAFKVLPPSLRRNAIISFKLLFTDQGDEVQLTHEVMMRNVP